MKASVLDRLGVIPAGWAVTFFVAGAFVGSIAGCNDPNGRQRVSGEVVLNGEPVPNGQVSLRPFDTGPSAAGRIVDGEFILASEKGPLPGKYVVKIESQQPTGRTVTLAGTSLQVDEMQQVIPDRYNSDSQLVIEVTGSGENHFEFELQNE